MNPCECGCGQLARNRFVHGHNSPREAASVFWRGEDAGYGAIHMWLQDKHPKTGTCENCGATGQTQYAFDHRIGSHTRNREDYRELCPSCHLAYDVEIGHRTIPRGEEHPRATITEDQVRIIRRLRSEGRKIDEIVTDLGIKR